MREQAWDERRNNTRKRERDESKVERERRGE